MESLVGDLPALEVRSDLLYNRVLNPSGRGMDGNGRGSKNNGRDFD